MALFGKADDLSVILKKVEAETNPDSTDVTGFLELLASNPDFQIERNVWLFGHPARKVREFAAGLLPAKKTPQLLDAILKDATGRSPAVRQELARLVARNSPERVQARLGSLVHSGQLSEKELALELIEATPRWQDLLAYLKVTLKDHEPRVRQKTARILAGGLENYTIFLILRELVNDEDEVLRHIVIEAFAKRPNGEIVEPFFERLTLEGPELRSIMTKALTQLARSSQEQIEERILPMLGDENPVIRDIAVKLLSEMPDRTRFLKAFLIHCRTIACWLKERSIATLSKIQDSLLDPLIAIMQEGDDDLRVNAMMLASGSRHPRLLPLIQQIFLSRSDWWIRSLAADLLGNYPEEVVAETLAQRLEDPDLRYSVIAVLGKQGSPHAIKLLFECLKDENRGTRIAVLNAFLGTKDPGVQQVVLSTAESDPDDGVRERALAVLSSFSEAHRAQAEAIEARLRLQVAGRQGGPLELSMANDSLNQR